MCIAFDIVDDFDMMVLTRTVGLMIVLFQRVLQIGYKLIDAFSHVFENAFFNLETSSYIIVNAQDDFYAIHQKLFIWHQFIISAFFALTDKMSISFLGKT